jgi:hypothetical protein
MLPVGTFTCQRSPQTKEALPACMNAIRSGDASNPPGGVVGHSFESASTFDSVGELTEEACNAAAK